MPIPSANQKKCPKSVASTDVGVLLKTPTRARATPREDREDGELGPHPRAGVEASREATDRRHIEGERDVEGELHDEAPRLREPAYERAVKTLVVPQPVQLQEVPRHRPGQPRQEQEDGEGNPVRRIDAQEPALGVVPDRRRRGTSGAVGDERPVEQEPGDDEEQGDAEVEVRQEASRQ